MNILPFGIEEEGEPGAAAEGLARGVCRLLADMGYGTLSEFKLKSRRRADVIGLAGGGQFLIVEVKSSPGDFRSDGKWPEYLPFCDAFYFAVARDFPIRLLPPDCGVMVADSYYAAVSRRGAAAPMNGTRRRNQILRFGLTAARRLRGLEDAARQGGASTPGARRWRAPGRPPR